jgi:CelD/BcsL family acetyltransferase involved in cellulose biosynthesis
LAGCTLTRPANQVHLESITQLDHLEALRHAWDDLAARHSSPNPALTFEWFCSWWEAFADDRERFEVVIARDAGGLRLLAPLLFGTRRQWGLPWRETGFPTNAHTPAAAVLADEPATIDLLLDRLERVSGQWEVARFDHLTRGPGGSAEPLIEALQRAGWPHVVKRTRQAPVLELEGGWDEYLGTRSRSFRQSIRRRVRKAEEAGAHASLHSGRIVAAPLVERAFRVAEHSWAQRRGTAITSSPTLRRFYAGLAERAADRGWLSIAFLERDGVDIAFELSLDYAGARYNLKMGYDERYAGLAPGMVLRHHVLKDCFERSLAAFHFLGDREAHKDHWATRWQDHVRVTVYSRRRLLARGRHFMEGPLRRQLGRFALLRRLKARLSD